MKGHVHSNGSRGRPYRLILLLGFGIAIFGVMVIHKIRERRIFSVVIKEKDRQLNSLQLLLQKERQYGKEAKRKIGEMKEKLHTLRLQKMELDNRNFELHSTISSLRDEERLVEVAFEEKQNEIKQLKERYVETNCENNQSTALSEILREKEAEIEDLKQLLELPVKVWSVSTDDPANPVINITTNGSRSSRGESMVNEVKEESGKLQESITDELRNNTTQDAEISNNQSANIRNENGATQGLHDTRENGQTVTNRSKLTGEEQTQKLEGSKDGGFEHGSTNQNRDNENGGMDSQGSTDGKLFGKGERKNNGYGSDKVRHHASELQKPGDEEQEVLATANKESETRETTENLHGGGYTFRGRHGDLRRMRGKRWRIAGKSRNYNGDSKNDELAGTRDTGIVQSTLEIIRAERVRDENLESMDKDQKLSVDLTRNRPAPIDLNATVHDKLLQDKDRKLKIDQPIGLGHPKGKAHGEDTRAYTKKKTSKESPSGTTVLMHENLEKPGELRREVGKLDPNPQAKKGLHSTNISLGDSHTSVEKARRDTTINSKNKTASKEAKEQKPDETAHPEKQVIIQPNEH